ncbi:MAG: hypothetical protein GY862_27175 [Gammaproteobacteria bacterium]|nr:hypothetical protein [Gammaproteobacteria bacterium]MCP5013882.1 hypothetical protein [Ketobacter sp.]
MSNPIEAPKTPYRVAEERKRAGARWDEAIADVCEQLYIERRLKANGIDINELEEA